MLHKIIKNWSAEMHRAIVIKGIMRHRMSCERMVAESGELVNASVGVANPHREGETSLKVVTNLLAEMSTWFVVPVVALKWALVPVQSRGTDPTSSGCSPGGGAPGTQHGLREIHAANSVACETGMLSLIRSARPESACASESKFNTEGVRED